MTHVTRPVISKGLWRDLKVCHEMEPRFAERDQRGVLFMLTTGGGTRRAQDVRAMEEEYDWPRTHRLGYPDLVGPEVGINEMIEQFNARHERIQVVLVNQFGWSRQRLGRRLPKEMDIADLRRAADVEFGMATYEPFGISPLEPLCAGAVCVITNVCGCRGFVDYVTDGEPVDNVLVADFTKLDQPRGIEQLKQMDQAERDAIEQRESARVAEELLRRLPDNAEQRKALLSAGQKLVQKMGWDQVIEHKMVPMLQRVVANRDD
jgi:hypothetical protein